MCGDDDLQVSAKRDPPKLCWRPPAQHELAVPKARIEPNSCQLHAVHGVAHHTSHSINLSAFAAAADGIGTGTTRPL